MTHDQAYETLLAMLRQARDFCEHNDIDVPDSLGRTLTEVKQTRTLLKKLDEIIDRELDAQ